MFDLLIYLLKTFSICFCWKRPLITSWLFPSMDPLEARRHCLRYRRKSPFHRVLEMQLKAHHVPNSANRNAKRCLGCRCNLKMKMQEFNRQNYTDKLESLVWLYSHMGQWQVKVSMLYKRNLFTCECIHLNHFLKCIHVHTPTIFLFIINTKYSSINDKYKLQSVLINHVL